jgi:hypothetical protein
MPGTLQVEFGRRHRDIGSGRGLPHRAGDAVAINVERGAVGRADCVKGAIEGGNVWPGARVSAPAALAFAVVGSCAG